MMIKMIIRKENAPLGGTWEAEVVSCGLLSVGVTNNGASGELTQGETRGEEVSP